MAELSGIPTAADAPEVLRVAAAEALPIGRVLAGRYELRGRLGAGGMGAVYRAHDRELDEDVALKVVLPERVADPGALDGLRREVKLARQVAHPNVCRVFDVGESDGLWFLTMEHVDGRTLRALLAQAPPPAVEALALLGDITTGVAAAHAKGIVHRDLKPENVLVRRDGQAVVADFGLAHRPLPDAGVPHARAGTPGYMAPEQLRGDAVDARADVLALGVIGAELLAGARPTPGTPASTLAASISGVPPALAEALAAVLARAIRVEPGDRFADAAELAKALAAARGASTVDPAARDAPSAPHARPSPPPPEPARALSSSPPAPAASTPPPASGRRALAALTGVVAVAAAITAAALGSRAPPTAAAPIIAAPTTTGAPSPPERRPAVRVAAFENRSGDASLDGLAASLTDAMAAGLRAVPAVRVVGEGSAASPAWTTRGAVDRRGSAIHVTVQIEGEDGAASGEPLEVSGDAGELPSMLGAAVINEARLLAREHDRRFRAEHGTRDPAARAKVLQYLAMVGPAPRSVHFAAGLPLLDAAITADPAYAPALVERAYLRAIGAGGGKAVDRIAAAAADLDRAQAAAPDEPSVAEMRCRVLQVATAAAARPTDASIAAARDACRAALQVAPDSGYVPIALARLHDLACQDEDAILLLEKSLEIDRGLSGRALSHLVALSLTHGRMLVADRMSERLVALQDEEARLGPRAFTRRAGARPVENAHLFRAAALLRLGRLPAAAAELELELSSITSGRGNEIYEAAAIRGLARVSARGGAALAPDLARRLAALEARFREISAKEPEQAALVSDAYALVDPEAAVAWLDRAPPPASCKDAVDRALVLVAANRKDGARAALATCAPVEQWERSCVEGVRKLIDG